MGSPIEGKFYKYKMVRIGTGATERKTPQKTYWYIKEVDKSLQIWPLSPQGNSFGIPETLDCMEFAKLYVPELEYPVKVQSFSDNDKAVMLSIFSKYVKYKEDATAERFLTDLFALPNELLKTLDGFFQEVSVILRKGSLFNSAIKIYSKLIENHKHNSSLHFNIARVYFDMRDFEHCVTNLLLALEYTKDKDPILRFLEYLHSNNLIPAKLKASTNPLLGILE